MSGNNYVSLTYQTNKKRNDMAKKKPIYAILYMGTYNGSACSMCRMYKADSEGEAISKFTKANPKVSIDNDLIEIELLDETHKHFLLLSKGAK